MLTAYVAVYSVTIEPAHPGWHLRACKLQKVMSKLLPPFSDSFHNELSMTLCNKSRAKGTTHLAGRLVTLVREATIIHWSPTNVINALYSLVLWHSDSDWNSDLLWVPARALSLRHCRALAESRLCLDKIVMIKSPCTRLGNLREIQKYADQASKNPGKIQKYFVQSESIWRFLVKQLIVPAALNVPCAVDILVVF